jgi:Mce-associated membrane protein
MPPPRRRRPVQPATRVRLPRAARPHGEPADEEAPEPSNGAPGQATGLAEPPAQPPETELTGGTGVAEPAGDQTGGDRDDEDRAGEDRAGEAEPAGGSQAEAESAGEPEAGQAAAGEHVREPLLLPVCLGIVAVALGGLAVWFGLKSGGTPAAATGFGPGTPNAAIVDQAATTQVTQQIDTAVDRIFSYNYADTGRTADAARGLLTGPASAQYATLFKVVEQQAPKEKLVLTTTVTNSGVEMLNGDTARLLIFANQKDTGAAKASTTEAGAMFAVTAVKQNGQWKIDNIDTFSAPG